MKILFVAPHLITGGAERMITDLAKGLIGRGHEVGIATSGGHLVEEMAAAGVKPHINPRLAGRRPPNLISAAIWLAATIRTAGYEVVNGHSLITSVVARAAGFLSRGHARHVYTLHLIENQNAYRYLGRIVNRTSDAIITVSDSNRRRLERAGASPQKTYLVHNGVNLDSFPVADRSSVDRFRIGIVARMIPRKGHRYLFRALAKLAATRGYDWASVQVIGWGPEEQALRTLARDLGLHHTVNFLGDRHDVPSLLRDMDVLVLPSTYEGFPISIIEAMATGLPVIGSDVDGIPEIIAHEQTGLLVPPRDVSSLADSLARMADEPLLRSTLGTSAARLVRERFSVDAMVERTEHIFERVLQK